MVALNCNSVALLLSDGCCGDDAQLARSEVETINKIK